MIRDLGRGPMPGEEAGAPKITKEEQNDQSIEALIKEEEKRIARAKDMRRIFDSIAETVEVLFGEVFSGELFVGDYLGAQDTEFKLGPYLKNSKDQLGVFHLVDVLGEVFKKVYTYNELARRNVSSDRYDEVKNSPASEAAFILNGHQVVARVVPLSNNTSDENDYGEGREQVKLELIVPVLRDSEEGARSMADFNHNNAELKKFVDALKKKFYN